MRKTIPALGVFSAGLLLAGSPAQAVNTDMTSAVNVGIANGIQGHLPIQVPVNLCGNAIGLLGAASAHCVGGANANYASGHQHHLHKPHGYGHGHGHTFFHGSGGGSSDLTSLINVGALNGIQVDGRVQVPVNVCGNAIGILGAATASCVGGADANLYSPRHHHHLPIHHMGSHAPRAGTPTAAPVAAASKAAPAKAAPVTAAAAKKPVKLRVVAKPRKTEQGLLSNLLSPVTNLLRGGGNDHHGGFGWGGRTCGDVDMLSLGNVGIANGIQAHAPVQVPINISGNAIALGGFATASSLGGANANYC